MNSTLPKGPRTQHMSKSYGPDSNLYKFYSTQYSTTHSRNWDKFKPRPGKHTGTGYLSNFRPGVYYSARLDELDNPSMGRIVAGNYKSITHKHYLPYENPSGTELLPNQVHQVGTGFVRQKPITAPTYNEVANVCINTRSANAVTDIRPKQKPHLHKIRAKDPVELENTGFGPAFMKTETQTRFVGDQPDRSDMSTKTIGDNEISGFVHNKNVEPVTFHPDYAHKGDRPGYYTNRPTGISIMNTSFRPVRYPHGAEPVPQLAARSDRNTGFTADTKSKSAFAHRVMRDAYDKAGDMPAARLDYIKKNDPAEYVNTQHPNNYASITKKHFQGQQRPSLSEADRLNRTDVGWKELTGFSENNDRFVQTSDNPARFITHYTTRFVDNTPVSRDREGFLSGGLQVQKSDGYTKSTSVHSYGPELQPTATLRRLAPYVARSIKARDPFFDDHTHDNKQQMLKQPIISV